MRKIVAIALALLLLISNVGLAVNTHYCMGHAFETSLSLGIQDLDCGMEPNQNSCDYPFKDQKELNSSSCCDNEHIAVETDNNYQKINYSLSVDTNFLIAFVYTLPFNFPEYTKATLAYADKSPPPLEHDYQSLYQSFLL